MLVSTFKEAALFVLNQSRIHNYGRDEQIYLGSSYVGMSGYDTRGLSAHAPYNSENNAVLYALEDAAIPAFRSLVASLGLSTPVRVFKAEDCLEVEVGGKLWGKLGVNPFTPKLVISEGAEKTFRVETDVSFFEPLAESCKTFAYVTESSIGARFDAQLTCLPFYIRGTGEPFKLPRRLLNAAAAFGRSAMFLSRDTEGTVRVEDRYGRTVQTSEYTCPAGYLEPEISSLEGRGEAAHTVKIDAAALRTILEGMGTTYQPMQISSEGLIFGNGTFIPHKTPDLPFTVPLKTAHFLTALKAACYVSKDAWLMLNSDPHGPHKVALDVDGPRGQYGTLLGFRN